MNDTLTTLSPSAADPLTVLPVTLHPEPEASPEAQEDPETHDITAEGFRKRIQALMNEAATHGFKFLPPILDERNSPLPAVQLSDGRVAVYTCKPRAEHASNAKRLATKTGTPEMISAALFSQILTVNGARLEMADFMKLDLDDFGAIGDALPGNFSRLKTES